MTVSNEMQFFSLSVILLALLCKFVAWNCPSYSMFSIMCHAVMQNVTKWICTMPYILRNHLSQCKCLHANNKTNFLFIHSIHLTNFNLLNNNNFINVRWQIQIKNKLKLEFFFQYWMHVFLDVVGNFARRSKNFIDYIRMELYDKP